SFWTAHSLDRLTTTLCYLASVGAFLNDVTDGEDIDWSALVPHDSRRLPFELPKPGGGLVVEQWSGGGGCTLVVAKAVEVRLAIDPGRATALRPRQAAGALPNDGRPVVLQLLGGSDGGGGCSLALRQADKDGRERELATSRTEVLFAPGAFNAARPFTFVLSLQPGQYRLNDTAWIGGAPPKSR
ncbi:MAG TPA: hypothetical protein VFT55_17255, partial [Planctomycetota bacterium]|nr:hypothetical protein [Planctomycetota bacterium]